MWIWRIDGASGSLDWERVAVAGTDSDSDAPRLRLPGPVIAQLDNDDAPEMILTVPTDANGTNIRIGRQVHWNGDDLDQRNFQFPCSKWLR